MSCDTFRAAMAKDANSMESFMPLDKLLLLRLLLVALLVLLLLVLLLLLLLLLPALYTGLWCCWVA